MNFVYSASPTFLNKLKSLKSVFHIEEKNSEGHEAHCVNWEQGCPIFLIWSLVVPLASMDFVVETKWGNELNTFQLPSKQPGSKSKMRIERTRITYIGKLFSPQTHQKLAIKPLCPKMCTAPRATAQVCRWKQAHWHIATPMLRELAQPKCICISQARKLHEPAQTKPNLQIAYY